MSNQKTVWVFAEQKDGVLSSTTLELLGKGRALAEVLHTNVTAVLLGYQVEPLCQTLFHYGADRVLLADDKSLARYHMMRYTDTICEQARREQPEVFLLGATDLGRELAPRIARRLETGLTADCTALEIDPSDRLLLQHVPGFGGNVSAVIVTPKARPQMATVRPKVLEAPPCDPSRTGKIERVSPSPADDGLLQILASRCQEKAGCTIEDAEIIVAGGRGMGSKENFSLLEELAKALGGVVGATRDAVEEGWIGSDRMIGQTGKIVRPKLYIACGISGAMQHIAGMKDSAVIVAINTDANAPIFSAADLGIVGDAKAIVPALTAAILQRRN